MTQVGKAVAENSATLPRIAIRFENSDGRYTATFGRFPDGRPSDIFLDGPYPFSSVARMATMALQNGVPIEAVRGGVIGGPMATALDRVIAFVSGASQHQKGDGQ
jgi:hypothetical protein